MSFSLLFRKRIARNTDPLRRCYNGCHFSSVTEWSNWSEICSYRTLVDAEGSRQTFQNINKSDEYKIQEVP